ncbi:MAG: nucleotidyltransferase domain-containing protein [Gemmatimonadota bacterium]|nr:nucleotidyltransferase domain-containing protein [Gemmatimonadota bacterium]
MSVDIERSLQDFFAEGSVPGLLSAYLFGSRAEGRAHAESDVDVGLLVDREAYPARSDRLELRVSLSGQLMALLATDRVDVVILNDAPPELGRRIVLDGKRVFCDDREADHAFRRDVQLRAADLVPFLRRTRRVKLESVRR